LPIAGGFCRTGPDRAQPFLTVKRPQQSQFRQ
jgi:hypothetical protein